MTDYLGELRRQTEGVRLVSKANVPITDPFSVPEWADTGVVSGTRKPIAPATNKLKYGKGEAPAKAYVRSLGMEGYLASEVADEVGCSVQLIRKLQKDPDIKAPTYVVPYGRNKIYIYTPEDVEEIREYWHSHRQLRVRSI